MGTREKEQHFFLRPRILIAVISIIVCSIKPSLLEDFRINVEKTIGAAYELIVIDNRNSSKGLCQVYNEGLHQASHDLICFCHEDILFNTSDWGIELKKVFDKHTDLGLVGVCGATYKSAYPTPWISVPTDYYRANITQEERDGSLSHRQILGNGDYSGVVVLDGCFIAGKKEIFEEYRWNESLLKNFHLYDMDICLRVGEKHVIAVCNNIGLIHRSLGGFDKSWLSESELFHSYYKTRLPISKLVTPAALKMLECYSLISYINRLLELKEPKSKIAYFLFKLWMYSPFSRNTLSMTKRFFE